MEGRFLLDIIIRKGSSILKLLSGEDQALLLRGNAFLVLNFRLHVGDRVIGLDVQRDCLSREGLDENLHSSSTQSKNKVESGFLLDIVVRKRTSIFQLFTREDQPLLLRWNSFLVLNLRLHVGDRIIWLDVQGDSLTREGLDEDLHGSSSQSENKVEGRFLLDIIIRKGSSILKLLSGEDQALLLRGNAFLILNLGLDVGNRVIGLNVQGDSLSGQRLHEDLHSSSSQSEHEMEGRFL